MPGPLEEVLNQLGIRNSEAYVGVDGVVRGSMVRILRTNEGFPDPARDGVQILRLGILSCVRSRPNKAVPDRLRRPGRDASTLKGRSIRSSEQRINAGIGAPS